MTMSKSSFIEHAAPAQCVNCPNSLAGRPIEYLGGQVGAGELSPGQASLLVAEGLLRCARKQRCGAIDKIIEDALTVRGMSD